MCANGTSPAGNGTKSCLACKAQGSAFAGSGGTCKPCSNGKEPSHDHKTCSDCRTGYAGIQGVCKKCDCLKNTCLNATGWEGQTQTKNIDNGRLCLGRETSSILYRNWDTPPIRTEHWGVVIRVVCISSPQTLHSCTPLIDLDESTWSAIGDVHHVTILTRVIRFPAIQSVPLCPCFFSQITGAAKCNGCSTGTGERFNCSTSKKYCERCTPGKQKGHTACLGPLAGTKGTDSRTESFSSLGRAPRQVLWFTTGAPLSV